MRVFLFVNWNRCRARRWERASRLVALEEGEFIAAGALDIGLGKSFHTVEGRLQESVVVLEFIGTHILGHGNQTADSHEGAGERLGDEQAIPGVKGPFAVDGDVENGHGDAGGAREQDGAGLGDEARATGAIDGEGNGVARLDFLAHAEQAAHGAATARAADGDEAETANHASGEFSVETGAAHHADVEVAPQVGSSEGALMPEGVHERALFEADGRILFAGDSELHRGPDETDGNGGSPGNECEEDALRRGEGRAAGAGIDGFVVEGCGWDGGHGVIVTGYARGRC